MAVLRKMIIQLNNFQADCYSTKEPVEIIDKIQKEILEIKIPRTGNDLTQLSEIIDMAIDRLENLQSGEITGVKSGFRLIDRMTCGFQKTDLIILAARPGMGKTALACNILDNIIMAGGSAAIFSLEMSSVQLVNRLLSKHARINSSKFRQGGLDSEQWQRINSAAAKIHDKKLIINDSSDLTYHDIRREARYYKKHFDIDILVVDYLQLVAGDQDKNRVVEISSVSRNFKQMAKELDIPVIALSQLNRQVETRGDKKPQLSDLRDSGAIEQDADLVMFIYRDDFYNDNSENSGISEIIFAKHRSGQTGTIQLQFVKELTSFFDLIYK